MVPLGCLLFLALAQASPAATVSGPWPAPNHTESAAIAKGLELGIGFVSLAGPESVEVRTHQTWTLLYTAGKAGVASGAGIELQL